MLKTFRRLRNAMRPELSPSDLATILREMSQEKSIETRMKALRSLMIWLRLPTKRHTDNEIELDSHTHSKDIRFRFLLQFIERNQEEKENFVELLRELLGQGVAIRLFCMTGVSENSGFFSELGDRLIGRFLPQVYGQLDLVEMFRLIFTEEEDAEWFEKSWEIIIPPILELVRSNGIKLTNLREEIDEALIIIGAQVSSLGVSKSMRSHFSGQKLSDSPFVKLNKVINSPTLTNEDILFEVGECQKLLKRVLAVAEHTGVSVSLIYSIELTTALLMRVEMLVLLRKEQSSNNKHWIISHFIARLIKSELRRQGIREFLDENMRMLARKIVERAGEKGDNYIASTAQEKQQLFVAASWAGVLTAFTALIKVLIGYANFALLFEGFFYFINYAIGFLLMQRYHLALSSKQPAFTASALSRKFEQFMQTKELDEITSEVRKISFSQLLASIGNLLWVIPSVMALDWSYFWWKGEHLVSASYAQTLIDKHNLLTSGTIFYASFTGVLLWLSSVVAGWVENWIVFRNIPQILYESSFLNSFLGKEKNRELSKKFPSMAGAASGNIAIAFFLAFPIILGKFTGIPLDIRHVTLATGTITLGLNALPWDISIIPVMISMALSILMMGTLNFGLSFYCSIRMAAHARGVPPRYLSVIFRYAFKKTGKNKVD